MVTWSPGVPYQEAWGLCLRVLSPLPHTGNSQGSFIGDCHSYEETQVGQEICRDAQRPPKTTLASCGCPWTSALPGTCSPKSPSNDKNPQSFSPSFQAPTHPSPHPSCTSSSFQEHLYSFLHQPHALVFIPFPRNFLGTALLILTSKPISLISSLLFQFPGPIELPLEICHGGKGPRRHDNRALVLLEAQHLLKIPSVFHSTCLKEMGRGNCSSHGSDKIGNQGLRRSPR